MDVRELKDKASQLFAKGKFAKAAETYEEYCAADRKDHQARLRCGDAWSKAGKKDKAIGAYALAAEGFARDGFLPRAIAASKLVLEIDPSHKGVQKMLADLYAQKSGGKAPTSRPSGVVSAPARNADPELEVSRTVAAPASSFAHRQDAIDLEPEKPLPPRRTLASPAVAAPSPMNRADALELPEYEIPMDDGPSTVGGGASNFAGRADAIEIEVEPAAATGPRPLTQTAIEIDVGVESAPVQGVEIEVPIEGVAISEPSPPPPPAALFELTDVVPTEVSTAPSAAAPPPPPVSYELTLDAPLPAPQPSAPTYELTEVADAPAPAAAPIEPSLPPGLRPRRPDPVAPPSVAAVSSPSSSRIWVPPAGAPSTAPTSGKSVSGSTDLERGLEAFTRFDPDAATAAAAASASVRPTPSFGSFTELDLEGDSLLHAVSAAASRAPVAAQLQAASEELMEAPDEKPEAGALPRIPLFSDLPEDAFIALFERCPLLRFDAGQVVFEQGDKADAFFVICGGQVRVFKTDGSSRRDVATLDEGSFFGEMALLSEAPRSASVEACAEDTQVLAISAEILTELSASYPAVASALKKFCRQRMLSNLMNHAALFAPFNRNDRRDLIQRFRAREVKKGEVIIKQGASSDGLYVVLSGEVSVEAGAQRIAALKEGEVFGEMSLLTRSPARATVKATRHTSLLRLPKQDFDTIILSHPQVLEHISVLIDERERAQHLSQRTEQMV